MKKLGFKNYFGYTICDFANNLAFCVMSSYLTVFCSDILGISGGVISIIMIAARIWDGINDPIMGFLVQKKKPGKNGKYRPFILLGGYPLAISAVLVFAKLTDNLTFNTIWVACAYILYGMLYTVLLVPYGSLASVMTSRDNERSILSMCRAIGGGLGNAPTILFPMFVMTAGATGNQMDAKKMLIGMVIIAVLMVILYTVSYKCTEENVAFEDAGEQMHILQTLKELIKDRAFVTMSLLGCLLIAVQMYMNTVNLYLFKDYFQKSGMNTVYMIVSYAPMVVMIPFANLIIKKVGKKEFCMVSLALSVIASVATWLLHIPASNIWLFIGLAFFINAGVGFLTLQVWSMAADIIDHREWKSGKREEAANYAIFTFMRKIGQAIAALAPWALSLVGYDSELAGTGTQSAEVLSGMYNVATAVPAAMFLIMFILSVIYPLNKKKSEQMHAELTAKREMEVAE